MNDSNPRLLTITSNDLGISWGPAIHYLELWNEYSGLPESLSVKGLAPNWTNKEPIIEPRFSLKRVRVPNIGKLRQVIFDLIVFAYLILHSKRYQLVYIRVSHWHILQIFFLMVSKKRFFIELNGLAKDDSVSAKKNSWMTRLVCWQEKWFCENASHLICVSKGIERTVRRGYKISGRTVTIRNGVAGQFFLRDKEWSDEVKVVIYVGTFTPWDGAAKIKEIAVKHPDIEFLMVGDGPGRADVQSRSSSNMIFTGMVDYADLSSLYADADAAIVIYEFERHRKVELSSIKTLEYLASRLPVFSTEVPGQELIKNRGYGYLVSEGESLIKGFDHFLSRYSEYLVALRNSDDLETTIGWRRTAMETKEIMKCF